MDGVHDLGGREGFGPIVDKADDKPFHADWEMRAFGIKEVSAASSSWTIDWFRHCRELVVPVDYLTRPYFDQRLTTRAAQLIDEGYLTLDEIKTRRLDLRAKAQRAAAKRGGRARLRQNANEFRRYRQHAAALRAGRDRAVSARRRLRSYASARICAGQGRGDPRPPRRPYPARCVGAWRGARRASLHGELRFARPLAGGERERRPRLRRPVGELS